MSAAMLAGVGITSVAQLKRLGSVRAYARVKASEARANLNLLWALEGALTGLPWQCEYAYAALFFGCTNVVVLSMPAVTVNDDLKRRAVELV
ncbi:MAG: hypothetical protein EBV92_11245 [Betaproteobacteria bacterium]|nr:hypothetical protein [Betaproteobacteria bacterium]